LVLLIGTVVTTGSRLTAGIEDISLRGNRVFVVVQKILKMLKRGEGLRRVKISKTIYPVPNLLIILLS